MPARRAPSRIVIASSLAAAIVFPTVGHAAAPKPTVSNGATLETPPAPGATVDKVLAFYQTEDFLDDLYSHLKDAAERRRQETGLDPGAAQRMLVLGERIYRKKNLYDVFKVAYAKATTLENMQTLFKWMNTPRGIALRQGIQRAYELGGFRAWHALYQREMKTAINKNRQNALTTFSTSFEDWELAISKKLGADYAISLAANTTATPAGKETLLALKKRISERRPGYIEDARLYYKVFDYVALRTMKNEEIDELSKFASTPAGQEATRAYREALEATMESAAKTLTAEFVKKTK